MAEEEWSIEPEIREETPESIPIEKKELPYQWELGQIIANLESISESFEMIARHYISITTPKHEDERTPAVQEQAEPDELPGFGERTSVHCTIIEFPVAEVKTSGRRVCDLLLELPSGGKIKMPLWGGVSNHVGKRVKQGDRVRFENVEVVAGWPDRETKALKWIPMESKVVKEGSA